MTEPEIKPKIPTPVIISQSHMQIYSKQVEGRGERKTQKGDWQILKEGTQPRPCRQLDFQMIEYEGK